MDMDDEEATLKAKLDATEDIDERLELRKQIREIRNRKFDEELKKISSGEASSSKLTNDINLRKSIRRTEPSVENGDPYGLLAYTSEQALQDLLNDTPYTETDKRRKIRARMREIRNAEVDCTVSDSTRTKTKTEEVSSKTTIKQQSPEPVRRTYREPSPEPVCEPSPEPIREPSPEPVRRRRPSPSPSPSPEREVSPEPERESSPEPARESSPEPVREPTPEPVRESPPEPVRQRHSDRYSESPDLEQQSSMSSNKYYDDEEMEESDSEYEDEYTDKDEDTMSRDVPDGRNKFQKSYGRNTEPPSAIVEKVLQTPEPGIRDGSDFKDRLKKRQDSHIPLALERPVATEGEQVDFRTSLKKKSDKPVVNLERKTEGPEQVDFRTALARKVEVPVKDEEPVGGVQIDFRTALKKKVEKPVFDKNPMPAAQVDFRNNLIKKVQTRTMEDKNLGCEQKDFRVVLGKAPPSPKTGRRHKSLNNQESVDRTQEDLERDTYSPTDLPDLRETPSPDVEKRGSINNIEITEKEYVEDSGDDATRTSFVRKASKKAPPPPPKKKITGPKLEHSEKTDNDDENIPAQDSASPVPDDIEEVSTVSLHEEQVNQEASVNNKIEDEAEEDNNKIQPKEDSDDDTDGYIRNKQIARAERMRRRQEKEKLKEVVDDPPEEDKSNEEQTYRRTRRTQESPAEPRSERNSRRTRRLKALGDSPEEQKKTETQPIEKEQQNGHIDEKEIQNEDVAHNEVSSAEMNGVHEKHEEEEKVEEVAEEKPDIVEQPAVNGDVKGEEEEEENTPSRTESRKSRKAKEEVTVSSDLLAEINKPKEEYATPKKSIEIRLREQKIGQSPRTPALTGRAAEREAERLKREAEREERAAARAKEREEAAKKRKEQKESFEKKMAEQKKAREMKNRTNFPRIGSSTRDSMKAFKEKLESNSPAPGPSPSPVPANSNITKLLGWVRKRTREYEGVSIENFHDSFADGLAFAALIHSFCPDMIPIDELSKATRRRNFEIAFAVARDEGVMDLLDVEDMVSMRSPDPKSVMTYVHSIYTTFQEPS